MPTFQANDSSVSSDSTKSKLTAKNGEKEAPIKINTLNLTSPSNYQNNENSNNKKMNVIIF